MTNEEFIEKLKKKALDYKNAVEDLSDKCRVFTKCSECFCKNDCNVPDNLKKNNGCNEIRKHTGKWAAKYEEISFDYMVDLHLSICEHCGIDDP